MAHHSRLAATAINVFAVEREETQRFLDVSLPAYLIELGGQVSKSKEEE